MLTIHAATVILLRDGGSGPEILMVERGEQLAFAGGALYLLLPDAGAPGLLTFLTIYAVAMVTGALSHSPGGLGVFEGVILLLMPEAPKAGVLAALVMFRLIYTYIPFLLGVVVIAWQEWRALSQSRAGRIAPPPP